jgi:hypothetical protein
MTILSFSHSQQDINSVECLYTLLVFIQTPISKGFRSSGLLAGESFSRNRWNEQENEESDQRSKAS